MARVLWFGDAGCHTGFARVTHSIGDRLVTKYGHDVHVLAYNHRGDYWPTPLKLYRPNAVKGDDIWGLTRHIELLAKIEPDVCVMVHDANMLISMLFENGYDKDKVLLQYRPIISYIPVDGYNRPPAWASVLCNVTNVVAMSKFGQDAFPGSQLVYHGVDTDQFWPVSLKRPITVSNGAVITSKREAKKAFGYDPDGFLVLRVDKNSGRKDFASTWKALVPVMKRHRDIQAHFHTEGRSDTGPMLDTLFSREVDLAPRFFLPDLHNSFIGWEQEDLNALYNAADLFVTTSRGEGFGLTIAEALACGVPVIAQNVSAIPEVVGPGGVLLEPTVQITVPSGQDLWMADVGAFSEAIEDLYLHRSKRKALGEAGREHVVKSFSWDFAAERFHEYISALAESSPSEGVLAHGSDSGADSGDRVQDLHGSPAVESVG